MGISLLFYLVILLCYLWNALRSVVNYVSAAPMGVVVISTKQLTKESSNIDIEEVINRFEAFRLATGKYVPVAPGIVTTNVQVDEGGAPNRIKLHRPHPNWEGKSKAPCGQRKGAWLMKKKMRFWMNKLRATLGLPIVEYNHHRYAPNHLPDAPHPHPHHTHIHGLDKVALENMRPEFGQYATTDEPFVLRFTRAVNTLGWVVLQPSKTT